MIEGMQFDRPFRGGAGDIALETFNGVGDIVRGFSIQPINDNRSLGMQIMAGDYSTAAVFNPFQNPRSLGNLIGGELMGGGIQMAFRTPTTLPPVRFSAPKLSVMDWMSDVTFLKEMMEQQARWTVPDAPALGMGASRSVQQIAWGIHTVNVTPFRGGFLGKRFLQANPRVNAYELKINPKNQSFYLPHPSGGFVQFENVVGDFVVDGKLVTKNPSIYHVGDLPAFARASILDEALRQISAAGASGFKVRWLVSEQTAANQLMKLFELEEIPIEVILFEE